MKTPKTLIAGAIALVLSLGSAIAQDSTEDARKAFEDRLKGKPIGTGGGNNSTGITGSGGASIVAPSQPAKQVVTITYTAVSPMREWTNSDGKVIKAHLLAFAAPADGKQGPVIVIHNKNVRFLLEGGNKKPVDYPLANLSEEDQEFVMRIAEAAKNGPPKPASPAMKKPETATFEPLEKKE